MSAHDQVNVLLVDDQPAKLLTYEELLKDLDANLVKAASAQEALQFLLNNDVAVILIDVCMPELDGFQLAGMIREHPRFEKTAIIFVSAIYLSDLDRLRGFESGAVDYVPVPVVPEILRARVKVFVELFRKTRALERMNMELEDRVAARTMDLEASNKRLRVSEERLRLASEAAGFGTYDYNPRTGAFHCSVQMKSLVGWDGEKDMSVESFLDLVLDSDRGAVRRFLSAERAQESPQRVEFRVKRADGPRWLLGRGGALFDSAEAEAPSRAMGIVMDVTDRKQVEERQLLLMAELDHRVKNILANVGAIVKLSSRSSGSVRDFVEALDARIQAIAMAHSASRRDGWTGIDLKAYVSELLSPFTGGREQSIAMKGEAVALSPRAAQSLALVFHELATNAVKYGALSVREGRVTLSWERLDRGGRVRLIWRETGGPSPKPPFEKGFGTTVINAAASELQCEVSCSYPPEGLIFTLEGGIENAIQPQLPPNLATARVHDGADLGPAPRLRILLVEDELFIGLYVKEELERAGHHVVGPATDLKQGLDLADRLDFDFALLDIRLRDEMSVPIADELLRRGVNFAFVTGFEDNAILPEHLRSAPRFQKPYDHEAILKYISTLPAFAERDGACGQDGARGGLTGPRSTWISSPSTRNS